ncbi:[Protein-PII] uridylyltransferase [Leptospira biflexa serovar Patoc strain 'Patoc 1 (Ames)']|uniref:Bifunctional uridylyltransferase/uridylyl-removing enzyme n=1 Tax=Leptospira biflexa serovar Patoc (strain Patoc 1 / ATCC 23582 / Paris) TaxID=456481 RepID=B0SRF7_LEPBP|nr:HD domain-containing protein [Leptospira biflexa]ABZ95738.1 [Protein-PII] uridylyltransferase [Leptospira biflexa serovar Patoc strain 'Patoc 1 (Ames)']ABZ99449.1 [Protein-PII] uridylyltransferase [Leptospira biflexa serovar Patoc strain 'Patoc 1 (Paris)']
MMKSELKAKLQRTFPKAKTVSSGRLFTRQLSNLVDDSLRSVFLEVSNGIPIKDHLCLIAVGGYGRRELAPYSDIDLLYLHDGKLSDKVLSEIISKINTFLYNNDKEVGHSCRTIKESFLYLNQIETYHAVLDARFLVGSELLFQKFKTDFLGKIPEKTIKEYNEWKLSYLRERIINSYNPILLSEPNIKNDPLGLRDIQQMYWIEKTNPLADSADGGIFDFYLIGDSLTLLSAYDFLLLARSALHIISGRKNDRLDLGLQAEVAEFLGFGPKNEIKTLERFMSQFYKAQKDVYFYIGTYLDEKTNLNKKRIHKELSNPDTLYDDIIQFFAESQKNEEEPSRIDLNEIRFASHFLDDDFKNQKSVLDCFLGMLRHKKRIGHTLTLMHECNVLGKLIPEFGACTNFPLFSYHHQYTVDEHTLLILRELDVLIADLWEDPQVQEVFNVCEKIEILALAILIHDAGKVKEGDHCQYGAELALIIAERFRLSEEDTELLRFLVAEHIVMSELSSKRDIYDPNLISSFAKQFSNENTLRLLYIMTIIDTKSVGQSVLTNWKKEILHFLFTSTLTYLQNKTNVSDTQERIETTLETYLVEKEGLTAEQAEQIVNFGMQIRPSSYLNYNTPRRVYQHFVLLHEWFGSGARFRLISEKEPAFVTLSIFANADKRMLLYLSGIISSLGLNLVGLRLFRTENEHLILQAQITDEFGSGEIAEQQIFEIESALGECIDGIVNIEDLASTTNIWKTLPQIPDGMVEELVKFANDLSETYSVLEVRVPDSIGLVYRILKSLIDFELEVIFVRISTSADFAYDSFHIQTKNGKKIEDTGLLLAIKEKILSVARVKENQGIMEISF